MCFICTKYTRIKFVWSVLSVFLNADIGTLFTTSDKETRTVSIDKFEVYSSSSYSDCVSKSLTYNIKWDNIKQRLLE